MQQRQKPHLREELKGEEPGMSQEGLSWLEGTESGDTDFPQPHSHLQPGVIKLLRTQVPATQRHKPGTLQPRVHALPTTASKKRGAKARGSGSSGQKLREEEQLRMTVFRANPGCALHPFNKPSGDETINSGKGECRILSNWLVVKETG